MTTDDQFGATCLECGILRVHIVNLERDLAAARAAQIAAQVEVGKWRSDFDAARAEVERLRQDNLELRVQLRGEADARVGDIEELSAGNATLERDLAALRQRHAELEKQLAQLREWKDAACKTMQDYVRNAERHAEAVRLAYIEGHGAGANDYCEALRSDGIVNADKCWDASEAKARLT